MVQLGSTGDKPQNTKRALGLVREAVSRKARFILLPEAWPYRGKPDPHRGYREIAETVPGPSLLPLCDEARRSKVFILAGSVCEKIAGSRKVYNTSVLIDARGRISAKYRKNHLFDARVGSVNARESRHFAAGRRGALAKIGTWTVGLSICYDLRFPMFYNRYRQRGVQVLCVPSAFTRITGREHWEVLLRARAVENLCYVLAPNQIGEDGKGIVSYGNSMIIDPWGKILARGSGDKEEVIYAELNKAWLKDRRGILGA